MLWQPYSMSRVALIVHHQDTYRAEWAWLILLAPERVPRMVRSMLQDYLEGGWLPMWKNIVGKAIFLTTTT